jgi:hypothetical protein
VPANDSRPALVFELVLRKSAYSSLRLARNPAVHTHTDVRRLTTAWFASMRSDCTGPCRAHCGPWLGTENGRETFESIPFAQAHRQCRRECAGRLDWRRSRASGAHILSFLRWIQWTGYSAIEARASYCVSHPITVRIHFIFLDLLSDSGGEPKDLQHSLCDAHFVYPRFAVLARFGRDVT